MAERRMFAKTIIDSDAFIDMPATAQLLYFHLGMRADDDGVVNNPKTIMRMIGCKDDDAKLLIAKKFIIQLDEQVIVIKHWKINNYIQSDRYKPSKYKELIDSLSIDENGAYSTQNTECIQSVYNMDTQVRLGKDSIGKDSIGKVNNTYCFELPLIDGTLAGITQSEVDFWKQCYPALDIMNELNQMKAWLDANPKNKKTRAGYKRFIINWLKRSQDKAPKVVAQQVVEEQTQVTPVIEEEKKFDWDALLSAGGQVDESEIQLEEEDVLPF